MLFETQQYNIPDEPNVSFIDPKEIESLLNDEQSSEEEITLIINRALSKNRLSLQETAILVNNRNPQLIEKVKQAATQLKKEIYGERVVLFAPLYVGNLCSNNCTYCGFKASNTKLKRTTLDNSSLIKEVEALQDAGHKRLVLVYGEHPKYGPDFIANSVKTAYQVKKGAGEIRRVNINAAPLSVEGFKTVHEAGIGTYQIFQETYHPETYKKVHPNGKKSDFDWRLTAFDRAFQAGIDDMGIGVLFGLYDWRYELLGLLRHVNHLEAIHKVGPHTISFPRIKDASGLDVDEKYFVNDEDFEYIVAILRLAVPYTGLILTARETPELRKKMMRLGISQIDGGTNIELGGYSKDDKTQNIDHEQFVINDDRSLSEVLDELIALGHIPSFCTSCYERDRTGEHFMEFSVPGFIKRFCQPNALLTLSEYLEDYGSEKSKRIGYQLIKDNLDRMPENKTKTDLLARLNRIKEGERNLNF